MYRRRQVLEIVKAQKQETEGYLNIYKTLSSQWGTVFFII